MPLPKSAIVIDVDVAKPRFGKNRNRNRKQWKFVLKAANGVKISDRDTYSNLAEIGEIWKKVVDGDEPVIMRITNGEEISLVTLRKQKNTETQQDTGDF